MGIAQRVDKLAGLETRHMCHHVGQEGIGRDIEGNADEDVGRALVELAGKPPVRDIELKEAVTWRQSHPADIGRVPGGDDEPSRIRVFADVRYDLADLVEAAAVAGGP